MKKRTLLSKILAVSVHESLLPLLSHGFTNKSDNNAMSVMTLRPMDPQVPKVSTAKTELPQVGIFF